MDEPGAGPSTLTSGIASSDSESQNSLGAQSQATEDEANNGETGICDIPPRIFGRIISLIPVSQHRSLTQVHSTWNEFIDTELGVDINVGKKSEYADSMDLIFSPLAQLEEIGISQIYFSNIYQAQIPKFKFPNLVKKMTFIDYVSEGIFHKIITDGYNCRQLILDLSSLHYLPNAANSLNTLTRLQTLKITNGTKNTGYDKEFRKDWVEITFRNIFNLLKSLQVPMLDGLIIEFPSNRSDFVHGKLAEAIFQCLINHAKTIKKLDIIYAGKILQGKIDETILNFDFTVKDLENVKLSHFSLKFIWFNVSDNIDNMTDIWENFLRTQCSLEEMIVKTIGNSTENAGLPFPVKLIKDNNETLRIFNWTMDEASQYDNSTIYCVHFALCSKLKELFLSSSTLNISTLKSAIHLPKSLVKVSIARIYLENEPVSSIALKLPNLEILDLTWIGQDDGHGMTMDVLKKVMENKFIKHLSITAGFNRESVEEESAEEVMNGFFSFIQMLVKSKYTDDETFEITLQRNGEYALKQ